MNKMMDIVEMEIEKIAEKGLTNSNIENAYKLVDMYKDLKTVEGMEDYGGYSRNSDGNSYEGDSYGRHYVRGHYSRDDGSYSNGHSMAYDRYMNEKRNYRSNQSSDCKERVMQSLEDYKNEFADKIENMAMDADCAEEQQTIRRYAQQIRSMR